MKWFFYALRLVLAAVFLYAGLIKASASAQFAVSLAPFTILPEALIDPVATLLPWIEITAALLIICHPTKKIGAAVIILLCLLFCAVIGWALSQDIIVSCACFGRDETPSSSKMQLTIVRNVFLTLAAAAVLFEDRLRPLSRTPDTARKTPMSA